MGRKRANPQDDYSVTIHQDQSGRWAWEIHRKSCRLGVKVYDGDFATEQDAKLAGEKALASFLRRLSEHEND
jgi:hypothetical protein